jgi:hypothetical protein
MLIPEPCDLIVSSLLGDWGLLILLSGRFGRPFTHGSKWNERDPKALPAPGIPYKALAYLVCCLAADLIDPLQVYGRGK